MAGGMAMIRFLGRRDLADGPFRGVFAGARGNQMIRLAFEPQKTEYGRQRRQADPALAQARRIQPGFIELESCRQQVGDGLMEAGHE